MNTTFLRNFSFSLGAILASSQALAQQDINSRVTQLEAQINQVSTETALGTYGAQSATANPTTGYGVSISTDLIYWHVYEGSTYTYTRDYQFAVSGVGTVGNQPSAFGVFTTDAKNIDFRWDFGFKTAVAYVLPHDDWDVNLEFTYFRTKGHGAKSDIIPVNESELIVRNNSNFGTLGYTEGAIKSITSEWKVRFYNINLELGRNYFFSQYLSLRPFMGLQNAWIRQHAEYDFFISGLANRGLLGSTGANLTNQTNDKRKNRFWGIGPRAGFDTKWYCNDSFSIYGSLAGALLWGTFHVKSIENSLQIDTSSLILDQTISTFSTATTTEPTRFVPTVQFDIGLCWEYAFTDSQTNLEIKLGYENQYWWRQNYIGNNTLVSADDLGFHGGLFEVKFDF